MKSINVLVGRNAIGHRRFFNVSRQWQLHQDAIDIRIFIQLVNETEQIFLAGGFVEIVIAGNDTGTLTIASFGAHVDGGCGVTTDQNDGQTGPATAILHMFFDGFTNTAYDGFTGDEPVKDFCLMVLVDCCHLDFIFIEK
jgi:hypothetical protein